MLPSVLTGRLLHHLAPRSPLTTLPPSLPPSLTGRLLHHLAEVEGLNLRTVEYLVLDEADRMFEMGFKDQVGMREGGVRCMSGWASMGGRGVGALHVRMGSRDQEGGREGLVRRMCAKMGFEGQVVAGERGHCAAHTASGSIDE